MPTRFKKTRHMRGSTFCGYGRVGKHKKHESGRGNAGGEHHHRINFDKYHPGYFGKVGMKHFHKKKNTEWKPTINLNNVTKLVEKELLCNAKLGEIPVVDLLQKGYAKLLGSGRLQVPLLIKARYVSELAEKKVRKAGGAVILQA